eukprot:gene9643-1861_t
MPCCKTILKAFFFISVLDCFSLLLCLSEDHSTHTADALPLWNTHRSCTVHASLYRLYRLNTGALYQHFVYTASDTSPLESLLEECNLMPTHVLRFLENTASEPTHPFNSQSHHAGNHLLVTTLLQNISAFGNMQLPMHHVLIDVLQQQSWPFLFKQDTQEHVLFSKQLSSTDIHTDKSRHLGANVHFGAIFAVGFDPPLLVTPLFLNPTFAWTFNAPVILSSGSSRKGLVLIVEHRELELAVTLNTITADKPRTATDPPTVGADRAVDKHLLNIAPMLTKNRQRPFNGKHTSYDYNSSKLLSSLSCTFLWECNTTRANEFFNLYGGDVGRRTHNPKLERFRNLSLELLRSVSHVLNTLMIPFWISSGTLLGFYRQCDFIDYSNDVDIGMFIEDYQHGIISAFQGAGMRLSHKFGVPDDGYELSFTKTMGGHHLKVDIFFFYHEGDGKVWNGGTQARTGNKYRYYFPIFDLCWTKFFDLFLRIPCDTENYLKANYGQEWFSPVTNWDWKSSPPNVQQVGQWPQSMWNIAVQCDVCPFPINLEI